MPSSPNCDSEDGELAVVLISNLENGDTVALCAGCFPAWARTMAAAFDRASAEQGADGPVVTQEPAEEGEAAPDPPRPKRGRSAAQAAQTTPQDGAATDPLPGDDLC